MRTHQATNILSMLNAIPTHSTPILHDNIHQPLFIYF